MKIDLLYSGEEAEHSGFGFVEITDFYAAQDSIISVEKEPVDRVLCAFPRTFVDVSATSPGQLLININEKSLFV